MIDLIFHGIVENLYLAKLQVMDPIKLLFITRNSDANIHFKGIFPLILYSMYKFELVVKLII
jgi:hypothetical protein